jgi:hypothetical protein
VKLPWNNLPEDAEMDIENTPVIAIDRQGKATVFGFYGNQQDEHVICTIQKHSEFVERFRQKIKRSRPFLPI